MRAPALVSFLCRAKRYHDMDEPKGGMKDRMWAVYLRNVFGEMNVNFWNLFHGETTRDKFSHVISSRSLFILASRRCCCVHVAVHA